MTPKKKLILIAEDESALGELLVFSLKEAGFETELSSDGRLALLRLAKPNPPDIMLLDWMMPGPSGIDICKKIRHNKNLRAMPIIMLSARGEEQDRIDGLNAGADDYVSKPFSMKELIARINSSLRRADLTNADSTVLHFDELEIQCNNYQILWQGKIIPFSPTGFRLLSHLAINKNKVWTRESLIDEVWGENIAIEPRTVDANIKRVRVLLKQITGRDFIKTARGFGYVFEF